jgi:hypothetical protein
MREFLAIVITFSIGLFVTAVLAYSLERRQLADNPVDLDADVRPGILAVSASGFGSKIPEGHPASSAENSTVRVR